MKKFNEKIREARVSLDMTQAELGEAVGVSQRMIVAYEAGDKKPSERKLHQLAKILNVSKQYLLNDDCENPNEGIEDDITDEKMRRSYAEKRVREMLRDNTALFAGGELTQKQKDNYFKALMAAYEACRDASENKESE